MKNEELRMKNVFYLHPDGSYRFRSSFFIFNFTPLAFWRGGGGEAFVLHFFDFLDSFLRFH